MAKKALDKDEVFEKFGFQPNAVGLRNRGWWIVEKIEDEESAGGASIGDLCVKARDGASNPMDMHAFKIPNCVGTAEDGFDCTYRYYYFSPLTVEQKAEQLE